MEKEGKKENLYFYMENEENELTRRRKNIIFLLPLFVRKLNEAQSFPND